MSEDREHRRLASEAFDVAVAGCLPGMELEWWGVDARGHVGCFITGGALHAPETILADKHGYMHVHEYFRTKFGAGALDGPFRSGALPVFVYDLPSGWGHRGTCHYERVHAPQARLHVTDVDTRVARVVSETVVCSSFDDHSFVSVADLVRPERVVWFRDRG